MPMVKGPNRRIPIGLYKKKKNNEGIEAKAQHHSHTHLGSIGKPPVDPDDEEYRRANEGVRREKRRRRRRKRRSPAAIAAKSKE